MVTFKVSLNQKNGISGGQVTQHECRAGWVIETTNGKIMLTDVISESRRRVGLLKVKDIHQNLFASKRYLKQLRFRKRGHWVKKFRLQ